MQIYDISISKEQFEAIPTDERLFFIQIGHLANELLTLNRLLLFASTTPTTTLLEERAKNSQGLLLIRLCCGKLFEGWQMLQSDYFSPKLSKKYDGLLDAKGKEGLDQIKKYFSTQNLIKDIRDNFAFHYSSDDLRTQGGKSDKTDTLNIYLGEAQGNSYYYFADVLVGRAMMTKVIGVDPQQAMNTIYGDPMKAIQWFLDFIHSCMIILVEKHLGTRLEAPTTNTIEIKNPKRIKDVQLPFFLADEG